MTNDCGSCFYTDTDFEVGQDTKTTVSDSLYKTNGWFLLGKKMVS